MAALANNLSVDTVLSALPDTLVGIWISCGSPRGKQYDILHLLWKLEKATKVHLDPTDAKWKLGMASPQTTQPQTGSPDVSVAVGRHICIAVECLSVTLCEDGYKQITFVNTENQTSRYIYKWKTTANTAKIMGRYLLRAIVSEHAKDYTVIKYAKLTKR